jgi:hypothetical protein
VTKSSNPVLLLTDAERSALRKAKITVRRLGDYRPEDVVLATAGIMTLDRAREHCALAAHHEVDGIGTGLATDFWKAGFAHPRELVGLSAEAIAVRVEKAWNRNVDDNYMRSLEAAVAGVERRFGSRAVSPATGPRARLAPIVAPKPRLKPLPGGTKRAVILKRPYVATLDQLRITRKGDTAVIEYAEDSVWVTNLQIGPELASMSDEDVLALFNGGIEASADHRREHEFPAIEIPVGKPQIEWTEDTQHWLARGHVLRCVIHDDENRMPRVIVDDKDLSWEQFGQVVVTFAGWGARIVFVADDELDEEPHIEVRERDEDGR